MRGVVLSNDDEASSPTERLSRAAMDWSSRRAGSKFNPNAGGGDADVATSASVSGDVGGDSDVRM